MIKIILSLSIVFCSLLGAADSRISFQHVKADTRLLFVFNQPNYAPGDTAFFSGFVLFENGEEADGKQLVNIALLNDKNQEILATRMWFYAGEGVGQILLPSDIRPGIYRLVSFIEYGIPQKSIVPYSSEFIVSGKNRFLYAPQNHTELDSLPVTISLPEKVFAPRQHVSIPFTSMPKGEAALRFLAVSVYKEELFQPKRSIAHLLESGRSLSLRDSLSQLIGLTHAIYFAGQVVHKATGKPASDSTRITFYLNKNDLVYPIYTRSNGLFKFPLFSAFETQRVFYVISSRGRILDDYKVVVFRPTLIAEHIPFTESDIADPYPAYNVRRRMINESYDYFTFRRSTSAIDHEENEFDGDHEVVLDKYEPFGSMEEIFVNVVPMVKFRKGNNGGRIRIFLKQTAEIAERDPVYIIDGIMTGNTRYVLEMDPRSVKKIHVLRSPKTLNRFGDLGNSGILIIETNDRQNYNEYSENAIPVAGVSPSLRRGDAGMAVGRSRPRVPDLRPVLYWNPSIGTSKIGSFDFFTSDETGYYVVETVGIQNDKVLVSRMRIQVAKPN